LKLEETMDEYDADEDNFDDVYQDNEVEDIADEDYEED
jgi:hypothetical protein